MVAGMAVVYGRWWLLRRWCIVEGGRGGGGAWNTVAGVAVVHGIRCCMLDGC